MMTFLIALVAFLAMLLLVVAVHEWGHYIAARFFGVRVLRFSVGFGKPFYSKTDAAGTEWALAPIPLGGYVHLLDKNTAKKLNLAPELTMEAQNNWRRFVIYVAGPLANVVLSFIILTGVLSAGEIGITARIGKIQEGTVAANAGLSAGDEIIRVNGEDTPLWRQAVIAMVDATLGEKEIYIETATGGHSIAKGTVLPEAIEDGFPQALGIYPDLNYITQTINAVIEGTPAAAAGVQKGDVIVAINDNVLESWRDTAEVLSALPGQTVELIIWRGETYLTLVATIAATEVEGRVVGQLGISPSFDRNKLRTLLVTVHLGTGGALLAAGGQTIKDISRTFQFLTHIISGNLSFEKNISGPVGMARGAGIAAEAGWLSWWRFVALISISLAVINLLPLPVLDGGHIVICVVQALIRRPLPDAALAIIERIGAALLFGLMFVVIALDLIKL
ncbi:MAG: RIP metalloprotease RseP [Gammaproteobacteria bacterium WSBS_2016_MAG_OTU1]